MPDRELLEERLEFHGPLTLEELGVNSYGAKACGLGVVHVSGHFRSHISFPIKDLFPGLGKETLCFLVSQMQELGLRIGRVIPQSKSEGFYSAITRLLNDLFKKTRPEALAAMRLHYLKKDDISHPSDIRSRRAALFELLSHRDVDYLVYAEHKCTWTPRGLYALARVHENQRQKAQVADFNGFKEVFLQQDRQWNFAGVAGKLGWSNGYAHNYAALAREAGQPLKVYVIGGDWQRLFDFGVQKLPKEKRSEVVAGLAYKLLREGLDCGVDDVLDRLCTVAAMVGPHNRTGVLTYGCTSAELGRDEEFLKKEGLIIASRSGSQITLEVTRLGSKLYTALEQAGRLDETGHYMHI